MDFIQQTAFRGRIDSEGNLIGTRKITGYVAKIHEDGELKGTIDVQEFNDAYDEDVQEMRGAGYHEGVRLCATKINGCGFLIVPLMFSEVVITQNPSNQEEYVIGFSHAKTIQMTSHESIQIGAIEHEDFNETDDGLEKDFDELEETGKKAVTDYTTESIRDEVSIDGEGFIEEKTSEKKTITVGDTTITIEGLKVTIETSDTVTIKADKANIDVNESEIKTNSSNIEGNSVTIKGNNVEITGGNLKVGGAVSTPGVGPFNAIAACPFSGAPHGGTMVSGT